MWPALLFDGQAATSEASERRLDDPRFQHELHALLVCRVHHHADPKMLNNTAQTEEAEEYAHGRHVGAGGALCTRSGSALLNPPILGP
jgi:hypothetical protein